MSGKWHLVTYKDVMSIHPDVNGYAGGGVVTIGSTALNFRSHRNGSHRGEKMVYRAFSEGDHSTARLIATAPELIDALNGMVGLVQLIDRRELELQVNHRFVEALRVIAKVEGDGVETEKS